MNPYDPDFDPTPNAVKSVMGLYLYVILVLVWVTAMSSMWVSC